MTGRIPREFIDDLIQRVDIVELINSHVPLKKAGSHFVARCPFHNEKTPSFSVNPEKQFFYCFGCGSTGNVIGFLMDYGHLGFVEAVEDIASFVGVEVPTESASQSEAQGQRLKTLYEVQQSVSRYYQQQLHKMSPDGVNYLKRRGLNAEICKRFGIGYAPAEWNGLDGHFDRQLLLECGLQIEKDNGKRYDRFRNRIMFPIRDRRGRVIGFGGRVLDDSTPKYLNSPETITFHKSKEVYGLFELLKSCSKPQRIIVVEGYMDVLALAQMGIPFSAATLGTAMSRDHIELLFRFTSELVFCFDGDSAGQQAAWRALETALPSLRDRRQIRFMLLPTGQDPDSIVRSQGKENFIQHINSAILFSEYFFTQLTINHDISGIEGRNALFQSAKPLLRKLPNSSFRDMMLSRLGELARLQNAESSLATNDNNYRDNEKSKTPKRLSPSTFRTAIALLVQQPSLERFIDPLKADWDNSELPALNLLKELAEMIQKTPNLTTGGILEHFRGLPEERIIKKLIRWDTLIPSHGIEREFQDAIMRIGDQINQETIVKLLAKAGSNALNDPEKRKLQDLLIRSKTKH